MDNILTPFIEEPEKEFHVRELSKILKKSPTTISKYLKEYAKEKILISENRLNHLFFKANTESRGYKSRKIAYNLSLLETSGLIDFIEKELNYPPGIILFGSFAKGENSKRSDIDIFVLTPMKKEIDLKKFEKKIGHVIQLFVHSEKEMEKMKNSNKELLNSFLNGIVLRGNIEVFK